MGPSGCQSKLNGELSGCQSKWGAKRLPVLMRGPSGWQSKKGQVVASLDVVNLLPVYMGQVVAILKGAK